MTEHRHVLVIEDDPQLRRFLKRSLEDQHYKVFIAEKGADGLRLAFDHRPHLVLLDLLLPDMDGGRVLDQLRAVSRVPVIVLSANGAVQDKIDLLERGANDFMTKPFDMGELLARMRAALRQSILSTGAAPIFRRGSLLIDLVRQEVSKAGRIISLSAREFSLISFLALHADKVVSQRMIMLEVWGEGQLANTQYLRIFIGRLRKKLEADPARPRLISTVSGVGYRLNSCES